ncbi:MAG: hypothetical protein P4L65_03885 [Legionella sp.]|nr:hypothetical protein [Legionella sp.]
MTVLCYVRPWNKQQFKIIAEHAFPEEQIHFISDFPKHAPFFLQEKLVEEFQKEKKSSISCIPDAELNDIIVRCRLLRNIDRKQAISLVNACYKTVCNLFDELQPQYVIGLTVDSYVIDLIRFVAEERGLTYFGLVPLFINGYCRISARGELGNVREVSDDEVDEVYHRLINLQEKPSFLNILSSNSELKKMWRKNKAKRALRLFYMMLMRLRSPAHKYCYHYWHSYILMKISGEKIDTAVFDDFELSTSQSCYLPLQYIPECTVDYWAKDIEVINYYQCLFEVLNKLSAANIVIYVKEHPNCLAIRPKNFYKKLKTIPGVTLINPSLSSSELVQDTDFTLVWTGSAGMEAALLDKPVVHLGSPYYVNDEAHCFIDWQTFENNKYKLPILKSSEQIKKSIIRNVIESAVKSTFYPDPRELSQKENEDLAARLGRSIQDALNNKSRQI